MAASDPKELLQALAFAYFAENPYPASGDIDAKEKHIVNWYKSFIDIENLKPLQSYVSKVFPFTLVMAIYNANTKEKNEVQVHEHVKISYNTAKKLLESGLLGDMKNYIFIEQNDPLTHKIKNDPLNRLKKVFGFTGRFDLLSAIDLFAIKKDTSIQNTIINELDTHITSATDATILSNFSYGTTGRHTYRTILNNHFAHRNLIGISLKMADSPSSTPHLLIVGTAKGLNASQEKAIDPYTRFLSVLMANVDRIGELISKLITIKSFNFEDNTQSWYTTISFNYSKVGLREFDDVDFKLFTWDGGGYNGQFAIGPHTSEQWVGGAAFSSADTFFKQYTGYAKIIKELIAIRQHAFVYAITRGNPDFTEESSAYARKQLVNEFNAAVKQISAEKIIYKVLLNRDVLNFFTKYDKITGRKDKSWDVYRTEIIRRCQSESNRTGWHHMGMSNTRFTSHEKHLETGYANAQGQWFLARGGKGYSGEMYIKQRLFLTIFGLISKKGYKVFESLTGDINAIRGAIRVEVNKVKKNMIASLDAAPHILMS